MQYSTLLRKLAKEYPYILTFPFERTSTLDGQEEEPVITKSLEDAYNYAHNKWRQRVVCGRKIDLSLEEILQTDKTKFPLTIIETNDEGIIEKVIVDINSPLCLSYLKIKHGEAKYVQIHHDGFNTLWVPYPRSLNYCSKDAKFGPRQTDKYNSYTILPEENSKAYFSAIVQAH